MARLDFIPQLFEPVGRRKAVTAALTCDSWESGERVGVRDIISGNIRRLSFAGGGYLLELVVERRDRHWEYVGRLYRGNQVENRVVLRVGSLRMLPGSGGFIRWLSGRLTRNINLATPGATIQIEGISW